MSKIKILVINTVGLTRNGITTVIYDYYSKFDKENFDIHVLAVKENDENIVNQFIDSGMKAVFTPSRKKNVIKYTFALLKLLLREKYDILHVHGNSATMAIELFIAKLCRCKIRIAHSHNSVCDARKADKLLRQLFYKTYTDAFACGENAGKWLFNGKEFRIIKNGRDINKYIYNESIRRKIRAQLELDEDTVAVGHIGNFNEQKNHEYLINIFKAILKMNSNCKLYLAGYGHLENNIKEQVSKLKIEDKVVFLGLIDNVNELLQAMDVMVLPSLYEGLPLVAIEWQMAALPCVLSDVITKECVFTDLVKFRSLNDSFDKWAESVLELTKNDRKKMSHNIAELSLDSGYDINSNVKKLMDYFNKRVKGE